MSIDLDAPSAVLDHARGVLAERFGVGITTADRIIHDVARTQRCGVMDLAAAIVASCTTDGPALPRSLYTKGAA